MIVAKIFKGGTGYLGYEINGHAGYAEYGNDIVCAAISIASQLVLNQLKIFDVKYNDKIDNGFMYVMVKKYSYSASLLIESLHQALMDIQSQYPNHISVGLLKVEYEEGNINAR